MKKILFVLIAVVLFVLAFIPQAGQAKAASLITYVDGRYMWGEGVVFTFAGTGFHNRDVLDTSIFVGSNFHDLGCTVNKEKTRIVCIGRGSLTDYAGKTGIIHLAGQLFYVTIPDRDIRAATETLTCTEGTMAGADVTFRTGGGDTFVLFVAGSTQSEIQKNAESFVDGSDITGILSIGDIYCSQEVPS
jgi:hypothetical protein